jgi:hypothetical protein
MVAEPTELRVVLQQQAALPREIGWEKRSCRLDGESGVQAELAKQSGFGLAHFHAALEPKEDSRLDEHC